MRSAYIFCAVWAALSGFPVSGGDKHPKTEEAKPLALAEAQPLAGDWELSIDPKKSPLKAMRATIVIKEMKSTSEASVAKGNIVFHYTIDTPAITEETMNAPQGGVDFLLVAKGKRRYLQILPAAPVKPDEKLLVEFTLEKDAWTINASKGRQYFFPAAISELELPWENLLWKRVVKKGK